MIALKNAPRYLILANALKDALFVLPVIVLFYQFKGVSLGDFFLIQGVAGITIFLMEIPTGYLGDLVSRKKNLLAGYAFWFFGYIWWIFGAGFWAMLGGELLFCVGISLCSGTKEAYLYDLLKKNHKEHKMHQKLSKSETVRGIFLIGATLSGAFLYQLVSPLTPLVVTMVCLVIGFTLIALLPDVPESRRQVAQGKSKLQDVLDLSKYAMKHPEIKWLILFPAVYGTATLILMWGLQPVMLVAAIPVFMFSIILGSNAFARTAFASISGKLLEKMGLNGVLKLSWILIFTAFLGAVLATFVGPFWVYPCLALMICGSASAVLSSVVTSTLVNHRIASDERATILSVKSMVSRLLSGAGMIALKPLFDTIGVSSTFLVCALVIIPIIWVSMPLLKLNLRVR